MTEDLLISVATGMRPKTSQIALRAIELAVAVLPTFRPELAATVHIATWDSEAPSYLPTVPQLEVFDMPHGVKPELVNKSLEKYGKNPSWWVTLDDDTVLGEMTLPYLINLAELDESLGLIGAWNDHSERNPERGTTRKLGDHDVQYDDGGHSFCVGGALHLIPKRALDRLGPYADMPRHEDAEYTDRVRLAGMKAVLVKTVPVAVLPDDKVVASYRDRIRAMHYGGWDPRTDRDR